MFRKSCRFGLALTLLFAFLLIIQPGVSVKAIPADIAATRVYGPSTFNSDGTNAASLNIPCGVAVASDGIYIADSQNNRVLFYPSSSVTANRVYGQSDFATRAANNGGISATSLKQPCAVAVDTSGVYISDSGNNRVLFYPGTSTTATRVYGQPDFNSNTPNNSGVSDHSLSNPLAIAVDSSGFYIVDNNNNRVLFYPGTSTTATRIYGQPNPTANTANNGSISENTLANPYGLTVAANGVYIADTGNHRVLFYPGTSTTATRIYGQPNPTANTANNGGISENTLARPYGVTTDANGVYIAEYDNSRALFYPGTSTTATRVYGQPNFTSASFSYDVATATSLRQPLSIVAGNGGIYIVDGLCDRVLFYSGSSTTATVAYGQNNNLNIISSVGGPSATSLNNSAGVTVDNSGGVYIADTAQHRVLYFPAGSTTATRVYGQPSFSSSVLNNGGVSASSLYSPTGVAVDNTGVYIADYGNHRILFYPGISTTATRVYGQIDFTSNSLNRDVTANTLTAPFSVVVDTTGVYAADHANSRVLFYPGTSTTATRVYGQPNMTSNLMNRNGLCSATSLNNPYGVAVDGTGVYIADTYNYRVLFYPGTSTTATRAYGSSSPDSCFGNSPAASLSSPYAVAVSVGGVYVTDYGKSRTLFYPGTSTTATRVYGQADFNSTTPNNGGISATSLNVPVGVALDSSGGLYVADPHNNRVLYYPSSTKALAVTAPATAVRGNTVTITVTARKADNTTDTTYTGTISFSSSDNTANLPASYSFVPADNGVKTFIVTFNTPGNRTITATDTATATITGGATVNVGKAATTTTLASLVSSSVFGQNITFTATVAANPSSGTPTGTVTFKDNATVLATVSLNGSGVATFSTATLAAGNHPITAEYNGDTGFSTSSATPLNYTVNKANTFASLNSSSTPATVGQTVTFTTNVAVVAPGSGTPTGTVTFAVDGTDQSPLALSGTTVAFSTNQLSAGSHTITARYNGDANFNASSLTNFTQTINPLTPTPQPIFSSNPPGGTNLALNLVPLNTSASISLIISNTGTANLVLTNSTSLAAPFTLNPNATVTVAPGTSQTLAIGCSPTKMGSYTTTLTYTTNDPTRPTVSYSLACSARPPKNASLFKSLTPARLYDSRSGTNAPLGGEGAIKLGEVRQLTATGKIGIPTTATAILANFTVTGAEGGGFVTVFPGDVADSTTASVNWYGSGARTVGNFAIIGLDKQGSFKLKGGGTADVIVDVVGYLEENTTEGGVFKALPTGTAPRLYDSRPVGESDGLVGSGDGKLLATQNRTIQVAGLNSPQNIPASATAVVVNLTAVGTNKGGFITLYPASGTVPNVTTVNWNDKNNASYPNIAGTVGNLALVPLSRDGKLTMTAGGNSSESGADVVIDVLGYIDSASGSDSGFYSVLQSPARLYDSRDTRGIYQSASSESGVLGGGATRAIKAGGLAGIPASAKSVIVRITTVNTGGAGFLALYPGTVWPKNANINTGKAEQVIGNLAVVELNNSSFTVLNGGTASTGFVLDVIGYIL